MKTDDKSLTRGTHYAHKSLTRGSTHSSFSSTFSLSFFNTWPYHTPQHVFPSTKNRQPCWLANSLKWGGMLLDLVCTDAHSTNRSTITWVFNLLFYSPNNQGLPLPACTRTLHYDERETVFLDIFLLFTIHLSLEHHR